MKHKFLTKAQLLSEKKQLLKWLDKETDADKLLKMRYYLNELGIIKYLKEIFSKAYDYKVAKNSYNVDIYMKRTYNNLDYNLFLNFNKDNLKSIGVFDIKTFNSHIKSKGAVAKFFLSFSGFTKKAEEVADELGIVTFGPKEILTLEKYLPIEKFITDCKTNRTKNKYIYNVRIKQETIIGTSSKASILAASMNMNINTVLENRRLGLIEKTKKEMELLLKEVRNIIARENEIQSYMVFNNKTLSELIRKRPNTKEELLDMEGIETYIIEKYGQFIIRAIH